jgi:hypothetical protein
MLICSPRRTERGKKTPACYSSHRAPRTVHSPAGARARRPGRVELVFDGHFDVIGQAWPAAAEEKRG